MQDLIERGSGPFFLLRDTLQIKTPAWAGVSVLLEQTTD
jgi:hypothetical protein